MKHLRLHPTSRLMAAALALLLGLASLSACSGDNNTTALDPDNPNLINGEEKITVDPFVYTQNDLSPYVTLGTYKGIEATRGPSALTDAEFEAQIAEICRQYAEPTKITDRAAAEGDTCNFDFSGFIDGVQFDGGTATGQSITLTGNGGYIDGFVTTIIGKMPGESFEIHTTFPEDYGSDDLNGKDAVFQCTLNYIEGEAIIPAFDDTFAQTYSDFQTADELRAALREAYDEQKAAASDNQLYADIWTQVVDNATILQYPEEKVTYIYQQFVTEYASYAAISYSETYEEYLARAGMTDEDVKQLARDQVKDDLVFYALVAAEGITISDDEYKDELPAFAESFNMTEEDMVSEYGEASIRDGMLWNKTQDLLLSWANVTEAE